MARIVYSGLIDSIRGSIGGTTFQNNKHGFTIKRKPNMIRPNSFLQNIRKNDFSIIARSWRDLSAAQRTAYDNYATNFPQYAKHNPTSQLNGYNVFMRYNALRILSGGSVLTAAGSSVPATDTLSFSLEDDAGAPTIVQTAVLGNGDWDVLYFLSLSLGPTKTFVGSATRFMTTSTSIDNEVDITDEYTAIYGTVPVVGDRVALDAVLIAGSNPFVLARTSEILTVVAY